MADAGSEAEAEQMHEGEHMVGEAGRVGVMLLDPLPLSVRLAVSISSWTTSR
jgi:hypothetical protein